MNFWRSPETPQEKNTLSDVERQAAFQEFLIKQMRLAIFLQRAGQKGPPPAPAFHAIC
jgi:hypothetical protein